MSLALVGSVGTAVLGATGIAINPAFGTGETRATNNLLVLWVFGFAANTLPAAPTDWLTAIQVQGTSCSSSIFYKIAAGGDTAPTIAGVAAVLLEGQLAEYSGNALIPLDKTGSAVGTTTPVVATTGGVDTQPGQLVIYSSGARYSTGPTGTLASTLNNGAAANDSTNNVTSTNNHYCFGYGITTSNGSADSDSLAYTTTGIVGAAVAVASFLPGAPNRPGLFLPPQLGPQAVGPTFFAPLQPVRITANQLPFSGALGFTASKNQTTAKTLAANLSFTGAAIRAMVRALVASLSFTGTLTLRTARALAAAVSFAGSITQSIVHNMSLAATLSFSGTLPRSIVAVLTASQGFGGNLQKQTSRALSGVLSFTGNVFRLRPKLLTATLSFTGGSLPKATGALLSASLSLNGAAQRGITHGLNAGLAFAGRVQRIISRTLPGVLNSTGAVVANRVLRRALTATLSFTGGLSRSIGALLPASLSLNGTAQRRIAHGLSAGLMLVGKVQRLIPRTLAGALRPTGGLASSRVIRRALTATLSFVGNSKRQIFHSLSATLAPIGITTKRSARSLSATLSTLGRTNKTGNKRFPASVGFAGSQARRMSKGLTGAISFVGQRQITWLRSLSAALTMTGNSTRQVGKILRGTIGFSSTLQRIGKRIMGGLWKRNTPSHIYAPTTIPFIISPGGGHSSDTDNLFDPTLAVDDPDPAFVSLPDWTARLYETEVPGPGAPSPHTYPSLPIMLIEPIDEDIQDPTQEK